MEKKATPFEHSLTISAPLDLNLSPVENTELNKNSGNFEDLVSNRRMHDDVSPDGDLKCKRLMTGHPSSSDFTQNSPGEAQACQFQQSVQNIRDDFQPYNGGFTVIDDATGAGRGQFVGSHALRISRALSTGNANQPTGFIHCNQGEPVGSSLVSNASQVSSMPTYSSIPVTDSAAMGGGFQFGSSHNPRFGKKDSGSRGNEHRQFRCSNQSESMNVDIMPNESQLSSLHSSQTSGTLNLPSLQSSQNSGTLSLCSSLGSAFQSNEGKQNFDISNQSNDHRHHPAYEGSFNFRDKNNAASMTQSGNQYIQTFDFQQNPNSLIPGVSSVLHVGFLSNVDGYHAVNCTGGVVSGQLSKLSGPSIGQFNPGENKNNKAPYVGPGLLMHDRNINPMATYDDIQNLHIYDRYPLPMVQSGVSHSNAASFGTPGVRHEAAVHGPVRSSRISGASAPAANVPHQLFFSPIQMSYHNSMTPVANPFVTQMLGHGQNMMIPRGMNFANANYHCVAGQHAANYSGGNYGLSTLGDIIEDSKHLYGSTETLLQASSEVLPQDHTVGDCRINQDGGRTQTNMVNLARPSSKSFPTVTAQGLGGSLLAFQHAKCTHTQASNVSVVNPSLQASGNISRIARGARSGQTVSSRNALIQSSKKVVAHASDQGRATKTLLNHLVALRATKPSSSVPKWGAAVPGPKNIQSIAFIPRQQDVICRTNAEGSGDSLSPLGARCDLCNIDLAFTPTRAAASSSARPEDPPSSAVLPCGHRYHDSCLREVGVSTEACKEPPCVACGFTDDLRHVGEKETPLSPTTS